VSHPIVKFSAESKIVVKLTNVELVEEVEQFKYWVPFINEPLVQYDPTGKGKPRFALVG
jgi:hypothetical protein